MPTWKEYELMMSLLARHKQETGENPHVDGAIDYFTQLKKEMPRPPQ
jgi:hypothetical protein